MELQRDALVPLCAYLQWRKGRCTGVSFMDSTSLVVCHNRRIHSHRVFADLAARGKSSVGWFFGFRRHLVVNDEGELLAFCLTPGNTDERQPVRDLGEKLWGKLFADKGYISQALFETLFDQNLQLITKLKRNMRNKLMPLLDKLLLRKRSLIETIATNSRISRRSNTLATAVCGTSSATSSPACLPTPGVPTSPAWASAPTTLCCRLSSANPYVELTLNLEQAAAYALAD